jgi:hypothetical protein
VCLVCWLCVAPSNDYRVLACLVSQQDIIRVRKRKGNLKALVSRIEVHDLQFVLCSSSSILFVSCISVLELGCVTSTIFGTELALDMLQRTLSSFGALGGWLGISTRSHAPGHPHLPKSALGAQI